MSAQRFKLGTFFGIGLYVHWSFSLLVGYVVYSTWAAGAVPSMIAFSVAQLLTVFMCVTLHEYGHALAARRYNVGTQDITLLPIGGVARLKQIPKIPWQEFVIAVAGPAVNVIIALVLVTAMLVAGGGWLFASLFQLFLGVVPPETLEATSARLNQVLDGPSVLGFALSILVINLLLVLFNLIPAFPMDGGRVLRSILAMLMPYGVATRWAQRIGLLCAILMAAFALSSDPPRVVMLLIAAFIVYAGLAEARQVEVREMVEGLSVGDVMTTAAPVVTAEMTLDQLQSWWRDHGGRSAAIVGINGVVLGQLRLSDLVGQLQSRRLHSAGQSPRGFAAEGPLLDPPSEVMGWEPTAIDLADPDAQSLDANQGLEALLSSARPKQREFAVIDPSGRLIGWLDLDTLRERAALARMQATAAPPLPLAPPTWALDQRV